MLSDRHAGWRRWCFPAACLILALATSLTFGQQTAAPTVTAPAAATHVEPPVPPSHGIDTGSTAWMLVSSALVFLMVPGLALFYGGMVRAKNVLNMFLCCMVAIGVIGPGFRRAEPAWRAAPRGLSWSMGLIAGGIL